MKRHKIKNMSKNVLWKVKKKTKRKTGSILTRSKLTVQDIKRKLATIVLKRKLEEIIRKKQNIGIYYKKLLIKRRGFSKNMWKFILSMIIMN